MGDQLHPTPEIVPVAEAIRGELAALLGDDAPAVADALGLLLDECRAAPDAGSRGRAEDGLYQLLAERDATRLRMDELLPRLVEERADPSYSGLLGVPEPVAVDRWICERGDYAYPVLDVDDTPPRVCPNHGIPLVFVPAEG
jgi:hypothetical protein